MKCTWPVLYLVWVAGDKNALSVFCDLFTSGSCFQPLFTDRFNLKAKIMCEDRL